jgi:CheY-like chemotaxis protein
MESARTVPQTTDTQTIMLVEDYDAIRLILRGHLEKMGYRVLEASDGDQAIDLAMSECKNLRLILMDLNLPVTDGLTATRQIRAIKELCDVPIIACTARSSEEQKESALAAGCTDFVAKPLDKKTIESIIEQYLPNNKRPATPPG